MQNNTLYGTYRTLCEGGSAARLRRDECAACARDTNKYASTHDL